MVMVLLYDVIVLWALPHSASKVYQFYLILSFYVPEQLNLEILTVF